MLKLTVLFNNCDSNTNSKRSLGLTHFQSILTLYDLQNIVQGGGGQAFKYAHGEEDPIEYYSAVCCNKYYD